MKFFQKHRLSFGIAGGSFVIIMSLAAFVQYQKSQRFSTPDRVQLAFASGEITEEERLLYLAYAILNTNLYPLGFEAMLAGVGLLHLKNFTKLLILHRCCVP